MLANLADRLDRHLGDGAAPSPAVRLLLAEEVRRFLRSTWDQAGISGGSIGLVGSFAVAEGGPRSDLDVVILVPRPVNSAAIEPLIRLLWDSGLHVDHSVRTPKETSAVFREDLPALTGLIGLQHVAGDAALTDQVSALVREEFRSNARRRVSDLLDDATRRWDQHDRLDCLNEPDLKNSMGGLRDVGLLRALAAAWLADYPHRPVGTAIEIILNVRDALHQETGRHVSRLLRTTQADVAALLKYPSDTAMMRDLQAAGTVIAEATRTAVETAEQSQKAWGPSALARRILQPRPPRGPRAMPADTEFVGPNLLVSQGRVGFPDPSMSADADRVLDLAVYSAESQTPISASTLADIGEAVHRRLDWNEPRLDGFVRLLAAGHGTLQTWTALDSVGLVGRWIPEWEPLRGRPQAAQFHKWTVDRHLLETVRHTHSILGGTESGISLDLDTREIPERPLLLAALLHDIGKQPPCGGPGHPDHGRHLAAPLLARMPLPANEQEFVLLLIQNHLLLAQSAIDSDPTDPKTLASLVHRCNDDPATLRALAVLTCADSLSAGPKAWTAWRESLIARCLGLALAAASPV